MEGRLKNGGKNRGREKTLMGMFLKYMVLFCVNVVLICIGAYLMIAILGRNGNGVSRQLSRAVDECT